MLRTFVCAGLALFLCGLVAAKEIRGVITKVDTKDDVTKVTFYETTFDKDTKKTTKGDEQTVVLAKDAKILKGTFDKDTKKTTYDPLENGIKADTFTKIDTEKGVRATITVDDDKKVITEIKTGGRGRKGQE